MKIVSVDVFAVILNEYHGKLDGTLGSRQPPCHASESNKLDERIPNGTR